MTSRVRFRCSRRYVTYLETLKCNYDVLETEIHLNATLLFMREKRKVRLEIVPAASLAAHRRFCARRTGG